jgi:hypothetical protein
MMESANEESAMDSDGFISGSDNRRARILREARMGTTTFFVILGAFGFVFLGGLLGSFFTVNTAERGVVEDLIVFACCRSWPVDEAAVHRWAD